MPLSRVAIAVVLSATALTIPAGPAAASVERCPAPQRGRVVVVGDTVVSLCVAAYECSETGVEVWVNDERAGGVCLPIHVDTFGWPESMLCATFAAFNEDVPGVTETDAEGDLTVNGEPEYDCPPYQH